MAESRPPSPEVVDLAGSFQRHRRDVPASSAVILSPHVLVRDSLQAILKRAGHSSVAAGDEETALDHVADSCPSLVLIDAVTHEGALGDAIKQIRVMGAGWERKPKIIAIGSQAKHGLQDMVDATLPADFSDVELLCTLELLLLNSPSSTPIESIPAAAKNPDSPFDDMVRHLGREFAAEFVRTAVGDMELQVMQIEAERFRLDAEKVRAALHAISGLALNIDADGLSEHCRRIRSLKDQALKLEVAKLGRDLRGMIAAAQQTAMLKLAG